MRPGVLPRLEVLAALAFSLIALWGAIAWTLYQARGQAIDSAASVRRSLALSLAEYQDASVRAIDLSLLMLRDEWRRNPKEFDAVVARHEAYLRKEKIVQVAILDADGWTRYSRLPLTAPRANFADRSYFQVQRDRSTDELHVSEPVLGRITKRWAIQITRPLRDDSGNFAGVIVFAVPPPALETIYHDIGLGAGGVVSLVRADGQLLARTGDLGRAAGVSVAGAAGLGGDDPPAGDFRRRARVDGVDRFYSYRKLQSYPLTVFVGQAFDTVLAPYYRQRTLLLMGGAIGTMLLAALLALAVARARDRRRFREQQESIMLDLHDSSIQSIYAVGLHLENSRRLIEKDPTRAAGLLAEAQANLNLVIQDLRELIAGEVPARLAEKDFVDALARFVPAPEEGSPSFALEIDPAAVRALNGEQAMHVLRIAREAVSNIVRHARARRACITLARVGDAIRLEVSDDGTGIGKAARRGVGLGLHHIEARARKLGGRATVASDARGTRITVEFPSQ